MMTTRAIVNADNEFTLDGIVFVIPEDNAGYKVFKKYDEVEEYENESFMESISVELSEDLKLKFYDEANQEVEGVFLKK